MPTHAEYLATGSRAAGWLDTHVRSIMRAGVISVPSDTSVQQAQRALVDHRIHAVLVVDLNQGRPLGWVTPQSLLQHLLKDAALTPVTVAIGERAESVSPSATVGEAVQLLLETGAHRLLVRRHPDSPAEGVLSEIDIIELATPRR